MRVSGSDRRHALARLAAGRPSIRASVAAAVHIGPG
jgi:hypothetical protein